ncbi:exported glycosyl hydrolase, family 16 [Vibrio ichthyoenteri ATCC 700023]|uniref:Beta-glucanase n=1 Tax=Vibrio ichthyoenteri ATCC 700023 TaxID=870968 RepID=F9S776_9VIBR|nr:family 16 glycosylhydrolase [Vibrio ichthyoenteri]EGU31963.1 exported glycosyl hydrolase, family 16 [Vibrio ichthyoenteri ATCC 700023]
MFKFTSIMLLCVLIVPLSVHAQSFQDDLTNLDSSKWWVADGWENGFPFLNRWESKAVSFNNRGMSIALKSDKTLDEQGQRTFYSGELRSHDYYAYGCYEIDMKPIQAPGVVTSFFLFAGPYDKPEDGSGLHNEIDIEFLGSNTNMVQLNFWTDDDDYANTHETLIFLDFDASQAFHRYGIYWGKEYLEWFIDGKSVFKVKNNKFDPLPNADHSKLRVMANVWATNPEISNWAGVFKQDQKARYKAKYRNFSYQQDTNCEP